MGQALAAGLGALEEFRVSVLVDLHEPADLFGARHVARLTDIPVGEIDAVVDFSAPDGVVESARWCAEHAVALVVGATGLSPDQRLEVEHAAEHTGIVLAANFSIGAVLAERFAAMAAPYFERAEIIELHHDRKVDAPSGTSLAAAAAIAAARARAGRAPLVDPTTRQTVAGARGADGGDGVRIHSVRLPGLIAHQEILFGGPGEGLTIRHDSFDRQSFVQGVALALANIDAAPRFVEGLGSFL